VFGVIIQVTDFGTVRVNAEMTKSDDDKLMTTKARRAASVTRDPRDHQDALWHHPIHVCSS
jgi:hypothetical protein